VDRDSGHGEVECVNETSDIGPSRIVEWAVPDWFEDPAVTAARAASRLAHQQWNRAADPQGWAAGEATPLQRLLYNRMIDSDVAYEVAKRAAQSRERLRV
jgi:hypothetical protein